MSRYLLILTTLSLSGDVSCFSQDAYQSRDGHPADHLHDYIRQVFGFGENPEWSHDSKRILFIDKPMGKSSSSIWRQV